MLAAHDFTCSIKEQWKKYTDDSETHYLEDTASVESDKNGLEEGFRIW